MQRRKFVFGSGAALASGSALIGSGAFTSVSAERDITVNVSDDSSALLELDPDSLDNSAYAIESDGSTGIDISKSASGDFSGEGVSPFALTEIEEVIEVTNQGTQEVAVTVESSSPSLADLDGEFELFATSLDGETRVNLRVGTEIKDLQIIGPGQSFALGFEVDTTGKDDEQLSNFEDEITGLNVTITASAEEVPDE
ncbi:DUF1102 domain-containing protein [Halorubrum trapanicum]|uniref:DUF1102 domain-containing protein n=1 Tax=Halorubrum trapanicum TaxID=29284 RepID=UPI003C6EFC2B